MEIEGRNIPRTPRLPLYTPAGSPRPDSAGSARLPADTASISGDPEAAEGFLEAWLRGASVDLAARHARVQAGQKQGREPESHAGMWIAGTGPAPAEEAPRSMASYDAWRLFDEAG